MSRKPDLTERYRADRALAMQDVAMLLRQRDAARATATTLHRRAQEAERLLGLAMRVGQAECESMRARMRAAERERDGWAAQCLDAEDGRAEARASLAAARRELHRIACGEQVEGDGLCEYGIEAANLRAELAALSGPGRAVNPDAYLRGLE